jgi:tRNA-2-methylthio-N6-dimethylallyladenosine synthase
MNYQPKKYYIKTYGCQANVADSGTMAGILEALGFENTPVKDGYRNEKEELLDVLPKTDLFIVNTCSVRQKSEDKVYGLGRVLKEAAAANNGKKPFVMISGCLVGSVKGKRKRFGFSELKKKTSFADSYASPSEIFDLPNTLFQNGLLDEWALKKFNKQKVKRSQDDRKQAYVNISSGCDNFCTFCVVPYARGKEVSRSEKEIMAEVKHLARQGYKEVMLCGQNVNSWGLSMSEKFEIRTGSDQKLPFADLLRKVHAIDGLEKIEFISSNPFDFTQDLIDVLKMPKISSYLHIAVQSGNNDVLERMNRRHTIDDFHALVADIRKVRPDIELGTDIIVGFPGETREQFMDTVELFKKVKFKVAFISMYSPRKGTPAEVHYEDDVSLDEKKWRHSYLTKVWKENKE